MQEFYGSKSYQISINIINMKIKFNSTQILVIFDIKFVFYILDSYINMFFK